MGELRDMQFTLHVKNTDFIVGNYNLFKAHTMPRISFIDIIYRFLISKDYCGSEIELRNLVFKNHISTSEGFDIKIQVIFKANSDHFQVSARSQQMGKGGKQLSPWEDNFQGAIYFVKEDHENKNIILNSLSLNQKKQVEIDAIYNLLKENGLIHNDFIRVKGNLIVEDEFWLGQLELTELGGQYIDYFYLHPAFLNTPIVVLNYYAIRKYPAINKPLLPVYIESFRAYDSLKKNCHIYLERENIKYNDETEINANIEIYDDRGDIKIVIKGMSLQTTEEKTNFT